MKALLVVDVQNDFLPGGALAVPYGDEVIAPINTLLSLPFDVIVASQDYHPADHVSFASTHKGTCGEVIEWDGLFQTLWPDHCVQGTHGVEFASGLFVDAFDKVVRKGEDKKIDSYSAFYDNERKASTCLSDYFKERGIKKVFIAGLALDWCVKFSALDSVEEGFETTVVVDACRAVNLLEGDRENALEEMKQKGVRLCVLSDLMKGE
jgi:nicotinamidase/pyrazinamidase